MRRILVDNARRKQTRKHGGGSQRVGPGLDDLAVPDGPADDLLALDEALDAARPARSAQGRAGRAALLRRPDGRRRRPRSSASPPRTADRHWAYARAWLRARVDRRHEP